MPTPVAHDDLVYTGTGRGGGGLAKVNSGGNGFEAEEVYFANKLPTAIGGAVLLDGYLYGTSAGGVDLRRFRHRPDQVADRSIGAGSLCYADGRLYLHGENGDVALVEATPEAYREKGRFTPPDQPERGHVAKAWAYPVVANGRLYIRDMGVAVVLRREAGSVTMNDRSLIVGLGEVLWDVFPDESRFGGAPANFASHAAMLGAEALVVSQVGDDDLGHECDRRALRARRRTPTSSRQAGNIQPEPFRSSSTRRAAALHDCPNVALGFHTVVRKALRSLATRADAVCFGTLAQRSETLANDHPTLHRCNPARLPQNL